MTTPHRTINDNFWVAMYAALRCTDSTPLRTMVEHVQATMKREEFLDAQRTFSREQAEPSLLNTVVALNLVDVLDVILPISDPSETSGADGFTALMVAAEHGHETMLRRLFPISEPTQMSTKGMTRDALMVALDAGQNGVIDDLLPVSNPRAFNLKGGTAVSSSIAKSSPDVVAKVLDWSKVPAPIDGRTGNTLLHAAVNDNRADLVDLLLTVCDPTARNSQQFTAAHLAVHNGQTAMVEAFVARDLPHEAWLAPSGDHAFEQTLNDLVAKREAQRVTSFWHAKAACLDRLIPTGVGASLLERGLIEMGPQALPRIHAWHEGRALRAVQTVDLGPTTSRSRL